MKLRSFFKMILGAALAPKAMPQQIHPEYLFADFDPTYGQELSTFARGCITQLDGSSLPSEDCHMSEEPPTTIIEKPSIDTDLDEPLPQRQACDGETCESCQ